MDMSYVVPTLTVISVLVNLLFAWEIKRLKGYDTDKNLELLDIRIVETHRKYVDKKQQTIQELKSKYVSNVVEQALQPPSKEEEHFPEHPALNHIRIVRGMLDRVDEEKQRELDKLEVEKKYLLKLKSYRFPWCKK